MDRDDFFVDGIKKGQIIELGDTVPLRWDASDFDGKWYFQWTLKGRLAGGIRPLLIEDVEYDPLTPNQDGKYEINVKVDKELDPTLKFLETSESPTFFFFISGYGRGLIDQYSIHGRTHKFKLEKRKKQIKDYIFCTLCGANHFVLKNSLNRSKMELIQCHRCQYYQHVKCVQRIQGIQDIGSFSFNQREQRYLCVHCSGSDDVNQNQTIQVIQQTVKMMMKNKIANGIVAKYKPKKYGFNKEELNKWDEDFLKEKCKQIGLNSSGDRRLIIHRMLTVNMFPRTPKKAAKLMAKLIPIPQWSSSKVSTLSTLKILGLCAGNGNIEIAILNQYPSSKYKLEITAVEKDIGRMESGQYLTSHHRNVRWICMDITNPQFIAKHIIPGQYDLVVMNPDFAICMTALYLGAMAIRNSTFEQKQVISLLPSSLLKIGEGRKRFYAKIPLFIETEYQIGKLDYHADREGSQAKRDADSIYVLKEMNPDRDFSLKYKRQTVDYGALPECERWEKALRDCHV